MKGLEGKTAVVTGRSSGIGHAIAIGLGREGVNVAVNHVGQPEGAEATNDAIDRGVQMCMKDVEAAGGPDSLAVRSPSPDRAEPVPR